MRTGLHRTFHSWVHSRNYRLYIIGQSISMSGTWMQTVAMGWLVLNLTGSGTALGGVIAVQYLPVLLLAPFGGVLADRFDKRRLLMFTQALAGVQAFALGILTATNLVQLWMVYALAAVLGMVTAVDNPTRQTFVMEMVGRESLTNAVTLSTVNVNVARAIGPAFAGVLIGAIGLSPCFLFNGASFVAVIVALGLMRKSELYAVDPQPRQKGQLRDGLRYVFATPSLRAPLILMAVVGTLAYEFQVILPLSAKYTFGGGAGTYGAMTATMGVGAVVGGLYVAGRNRSGDAALIRATIIFGAVILVAAAAPVLAVMLIVLLVVGAASIGFLSLASATIQLRADPAMRGRVMALWTVAFLGSTPVGGPIIGWVGEHAGPRWGLVVGGGSTLIGGLLAWRALHRSEGRLSRTAAVAGSSELKPAQARA